MNEPAKRTGIGSLLLKRTTPTEESRPMAVETEQGRAASPAPEPESPSRPDPSPSEPSPHPRKPKQERVRIRRTLHLEDDLDAQLNTVAGVERRERSQIVNELLRKHLHRYEITRKK